MDINFRSRSSLASEPLQENDLHWRGSPATPKFFPQGLVSDHITILGGTFTKARVGKNPISLGHKVPTEVVREQPGTHRKSFELFPTAAPVSRLCNWPCQGGGGATARFGNDSALRARSVHSYGKQKETNTAFPSSHLPPLSQAGSGSALPWPQGRHMGVCTCGHPAPVTQLQC